MSRVAYSVQHVAERADSFVAASGKSLRCFAPQCLARVSEQRADLIDAQRRPVDPRAAGKGYGAYGSYGGYAGYEESNSDRESVSEQA